MTFRSPQSWVHDPPELAPLLANRNAWAHSGLAISPAGELFAFHGGSLIFSNVTFPYASVYQTVDAGTYNLEIRAAGDPTTVLADLIGVTLTAGNVVDVFAIGSVAAGAVQLLAVTTQPETAQVGGRPVFINTGSCDNLSSDEFAVLNNAVAAQGAAVGSEAATIVENSVTVFNVGLQDMLTGTDLSITVRASEADNETVVACGEIGGVPVNNAALAIGLTEQNGSGISGIAYLATNGYQTIVTIYVAEGLSGDDSATPAA